MKYFFMLFVCLTLSHFGYTQNDDRGYIVKVGDKAPDITITYTDGTRKKLSDFRGKIVMLQFTGSWCGVCRKEMPFIEKDIWLKHKNNPHFALIGIDLKENREQTIQFGKDLNDEFNAGNIDSWDSVHQLSIVAQLEEIFDVMFDPEDILGLTSYAEGKKILSKYNVEL